MKNVVLKGAGGVLALLVLAGGFWLLRDDFLPTPWSTSLPFEYPGFAAADSDGNTYLIDRSLKRIVKTSSSGELVWALSGGSREPGHFFFADELSIAPNGDVYVLNRVPDAPGFYTVQAQILRYSASGGFLGVVAQRDYGDADRIPTLVQRGHWHSLQADESTVRWFDSTPTALLLCTVEAGERKTTPVLSGAADLLVPSASLLTDGRVIAVTKQGRILRQEQNGDSTVLFDASSAQAEATPWKLRTTNDGRVYFTDLTRNGIAELLPDGTAPLRFPSGGAPFYSLSSGGNGILGTTGDDGPRFFRADGTALAPPPAASYSWVSVAIHWLLWIVIAAFGATLVFLGRLMYVEGFQRTIPPFLKTVAGVVLLTGLVGVMVSFIILTNFSQRYSTEVLSKITQLVHLVPRLIDTDRLAAVAEPAQFGGDDYLALRSQIMGAIYGEKNQDNQGLYFAIHRVSGTQLTTFMYLNGDTTIRQPFGYLNDPEGPYQKALSGQTVAQYALDAWGSWMYSTGPIRDASGAVVGVFEMGGDLYSFTQENNRLIQSLSINILTVLVIFLLVLVEVTFLQDQMRKRALGLALAEQGVTTRRAEDRFHSVYLVRSVAGLFFVSASVSLLFLPLMMKQFYQPLWGLPEAVVYGLPVSTRLLFFGVGTIVGGNLARRWGWRPVFLLGLALSGLGLAAAALSTEMNLFLSSSVAIGWGAGLAMIGLRSLVNSEADSDSKGTGYGHFYAGVIAGTNVGVIVGSGLADLIGYSNVFWLALGLTMLTLVLVLRLFPQTKPVEKQADDLGIGKALGQFFTDPAVVRFSVLIVLPVYVASMVLYFFLPVFAQDQGVSNADMGRIFLLNGLVIVYAGPVLSRWLQSRLGSRRALLASSLLWAISLVPFVVWGTLPALIATIVLMGAAEAVAAVAQNEHLLALPVSSRIGADRSAGFFEVVGKVGETVAPILIGFAMLLGAQMGIAVVAGGLGLTLVAFWFVDLLSRRRGANA